MGRSTLTRFSVCSHCRLRPSELPSPETGEGATRGTGTPHNTQEPAAPGEAGPGLLAALGEGAFGGLAEEGTLLGHPGLGWGPGEKDRLQPHTPWHGRPCSLLLVALSLKLGSWAIPPRRAPVLSGGGHPRPPVTSGGHFVVQGVPPPPAHGHQAVEARGP